MPELNPSPKFPITEKPRLSPNPKSTLEYKDGGRGTPVIVNTPPQPSINPTEESAEIENLQNQINGKQDKLTFDSTPTQNSTNPVTSGGVYNALQNVGGEDIVTITATGVQSDEMAAKIEAAKAVFYSNRLYSRSQTASETSLDFYCQEQALTGDTRRYISYTIATKTVFEGLYSYSRVASVDGQNGTITTDASFEVTSGKVAKLTGQLPYLTTEPSDPNTAGFVKLVVLDEEPAAYKEGFLYFVTE